MSTELGTEPWLAERSAAPRPYEGSERYAIDVVVGKDRSGEGVTYHVVLEPGQRPLLRPGPAPDGAAATLELTRSDAEAEARGERRAVVGYMRGTTKTKGATRPLYEYFRLLD